MKTPIYKFSKKKIADNYNRMKQLISDTNICYATQANSEKGVLEKLVEQDAWFECASSNEYKRVIEAGAEKEKIIFGLPIKTKETIKEVYEIGCRYFVFDELMELEKIIKYAPQSKKIIRIYINDIVKENIEYGMEIEETLSLSDKWLEHIDGVCFHISNNTSSEAFIKVCERIEQIFIMLSKKHDKKYILNIGGGFDLNSDENFYQVVNNELARLKSLFKLETYAEPGTAIVCDAAKFYTKVIMVKPNGRSLDVYLDSGVPQGVAARKIPSDIGIYGENRKNRKRNIYRFMDCTCLGASLFIKRTDLNIQDNDILEFEGCGAYTTAFCNDFHAYKKCTIVIE